MKLTMLETEGTPMRLQIQTAVCKTKPALQYDLRYDLRQLVF